MRLATPQVAASAQAAAEVRGPLGALAGKAGIGEETGEPWQWVRWGKVYIKRSRRSISQCIAVYEKSLLNGHDLPISQLGNVHQIREMRWDIKGVA